jgi:hypothetical protein
VSDRSTAVGISGVRLEAPHHADCLCAKRDDEFTFIVQPLRSDPLPEYEYFARDGTKRGSNVNWQRFRCNDMKCPATVLIRWDVLARFVTDCARMAA